DAASHDARAFDLELVEEAGALLRVMVPREPLDTSARPPRLALVKSDARVVLDEPVEHTEARVDPKARPVLDRPVEAAGREEEERWTRAADLVVGLDAVGRRGRHQSPFTGRPART